LKPSPLLGDGRAQRANPSAPTQLSQNKYFNKQIAKAEKPTAWLRGTVSKHRFSPKFAIFAWYLFKKSLQIIPYLRTFLNFVPNKTS